MTQIHVHFGALGICGCQHVVELAVIPQADGEDLLRLARRELDKHWDRPLGMPDGTQLLRCGWGGMGVVGYFEIIDIDEMWAWGADFYVQSHSDQVERFDPPVIEVLFRWAPVVSS